MSVKQAYSAHIAKNIFFIILGLTALLFLLMFAVTVGAADISVKDVFLAVISGFLPVDTVEFNYTVLWHLRLPRLVMGVIAGSGLALAGVVMQGITRNPLVSPFTIGISSAAAFGAAIAIMFGVGFVKAGPLLVILNAFVFALLCAGIVFGLSSLKGTSPETLILAGIAISYYFSALTAVLQFFASEEELMMIVHWTFGSLTRAAWDEITISTIAFVIIFPLVMYFAWDLNAMMLTDDETAKSLGINTSRIRTILLVLSTLLTATIVSFTGIIGFVGLVAPHVTRLLIGGDNRFLLPATCITGAILVIGADIVGRILLPPIVLPIGVVVSFVGVPMFVYLLISKKEEFWR
jgi:iron complex transport system permease protein